MMRLILGTSRNGRSDVVWRLTTAWAVENGIETRRWITGCASRPAASIRRDPFDRAVFWARAWASDGTLLVEHFGDDAVEARGLLTSALEGYAHTAPRSCKARVRTIASFE